MARRLQKKNRRWGERLKVIAQLKFGVHLGSEQRNAADTGTSAAAAGAELSLQFPEEWSVMGSHSEILSQVEQLETQEPAVEKVWKELGGEQEARISAQQSPADPATPSLQWGQEGWPPKVQLELALSKELVSHNSRLVSSLSKHTFFLPRFVGAGGARLFSGIPSGTA